ncbi:hypothetical protein Hydth_0558 [Hydrogenobacter thermophilus TK-6]|uniref:Uncharacterized protein n=1 Tax=Hydrogenobacter thermophilus (strain DSM 6534 / IAM 12695 / TK-6) TaxID=608538 RepID=D3DGS0_HYDTT|nr:hypothetical protein [Hydrogenobacter thermophilus]ADO44957.1 hypothetical protein Hydth_0558 [Hydrogenobacter thermophilus TK-6]BAI69022.1 hypothetical protein HTH_0560 [Hydrogenobacter thermophilus TK-6]
MFDLLRRLLGLASAYSSAERQYGKKWYKSKTIWVNLIAFIALLLSEKLGISLTKEEQGALLVVINIALRIITKEPIVWSD